MGRTRRWTASLLTVLMLGAVLAGCGSRTNPPQPMPGWAVRGQAVIALPPYTTLNAFVPLLGIASYFPTNVQTTLLMYKPLLFVTATDSIDFGRSLAQSVRVSNDSRTFTVILNPKWTWTNGRPVTANDVAFTAVLAAASCAHRPAYPPSIYYGYAGCGSGGLGPLGTLTPDGIGWVSISAPNAATFHITVNRPVSASWFERNALAPLLPMPAAVWEKAAGIPVTPATSLTPAEIAVLLSYMGSFNNPNGVMDKPTAPPFSVVDGPYLFKSMVPHDYWEFTANPNYDGHLPAIKTLIFQSFNSSAAEQSALEMGQLSIGYLSPTALARHQTNISGYRLRSTRPPFCTFYLSLNLSPLAPSGIGLAFQDLAVRQALQLGLNQAAYIQILGDGYGVQQYGPIPPTPVLSVYNPKRMPPPLAYDPAKGKSLLLADGWAENNGVMTKTIDGKSVSLSFRLFLPPFSPSPVVKFLNVLSQDWAKEGIKATPFEAATMSSFNDQLGPATAATWATWYDGGWCYQPDFYPTGGALFSPTGFINIGDFQDPTLERLIAATYAPGTPAQARSAMTAYLAYTARILPGLLWLPDLNPPLEVSPWLHGSVANYNQIETANFPNYWTIGPP